MKKILILVLFLVAILLVSCNTETPSESMPIESASNESGLNESADDTASHVHDHTFKIDYDEKYHFLTCECGNVHKRGHRMEEGEVVKEPTCSEYGSRTIKCKDCEYSIEVPISTISHDYKDEFCIICGSHESGEYVTFEEVEGYGWIATLKTNGIHPYDIPLTELYIPTYTDTGEKVVGVGGFQKLHNLKKVVIPEGIRYICPLAFYNCTGLEEVVLPGDPTSTIEIQNDAFEECFKLKKINLTNSVVYLGVGAFYRCKSLESVEIPSSITELNNALFSGCTSLKKVVLPDTITTVGLGVFSDCYSLKEVDLGNSIPKLSKYMFEACSSLESIVIPDSVTSLDGRVFYGCDKLKNVVMSKNVKRIEELDFAACVPLESITIPKDVEYLGIGLFENCFALKEINYEGTIEEWNSLETYKTFSGSSVERIICSDGVIEL